jgi:modulator of FtsH protease HflK
MDWNGQDRPRDGGGFGNNPLGGNPFGKGFDDIATVGNILKFLATALICFGLFGSFYTVQPEEEAVVLRLGRYLTTEGPGLHYKIPFGVDRVTKVPTSVVFQESFGFYADSSGPRGRALSDESLMLTGDLNVADVQWVVQYRIADPQLYLFRARDPRKTIRDISLATMRRVVGDRTVNDVLTVGREEIAAAAQEKMQEVLDLYGLGIKIVLVKLQDVTPPEPVQPSFNLVNAAKQEQEQEINRAETHYNRIIPEARGKAEEEITRAQGYVTALLNRAQGDAERIRKLRTQYRKAPEATRLRLYLEAMEEILGQSKGLFLFDPNLKGILPYTPGAQQLQGFAAGMASLKSPEQTGRGTEGTK